MHFLRWLVLNSLSKFIKTLHITASCSTVRGGGGGGRGPRRIGEIFVRGPRYGTNGGRPGLSLTDRQKSAYQVSASARGSTLFIPPPLLNPTSYFTCLLLRAGGRGQLQYCRFDCGAAMFTASNRFCCDLIWRECLVWRSEHRAPVGGTFSVKVAVSGVRTWRNVCICPSVSLWREGI